MAKDKPSALIIVANGTEEVEAITPADVLNRCGVVVTVAGIGGTSLRGANGIPLAADKTVEDLAAAGATYDAVVIPGGDSGAREIAGNEPACGLIRRHAEAGRLIASICAAPALVLAPLGLLDGKPATCYPGYEGELGDAVSFTTDRVVESGDVITSRGPGTAMEFALAVGARLAGDDQAAAVREGMLVGA
ncbi:MAG: DJ-1 family glyoxalase III [Planctomycetota bacterium]